MTESYGGLPSRRPLTWEWTHSYVYVHISGPNYETPSESMFLRNIGADAVGMSTAPEVTVARHAEIRVLGKVPFLCLRV